MNLATRERYSIGDLILDVDAVSVTRTSGEDVGLPSLSFDLLVCLARHAPAVVSRDDLLEQVWPDLNVGEETLKQRVRLLRKALGDDSREPCYLASVRGKGYKLVPSVSLMEGTLSERDGISLTVHSRTRWIALSALAVILVVSAVFFPGRDDMAGTVETPTALGLDGPSLLHRARVYYNRYRSRDNQMAIDLLEQAVALDPDLAEAHALLSRALSQGPKLGLGYWPERARASAEEAITLAPDHPAGYIALGLSHDVAGRYSQGLTAYHEALTHDPDNGTAIGNAAYNLFVLGRLDESLEWNLKALDRKPDIHFGMIQVAENLSLLGFDDAAGQWFDKVRALQPDNIFGERNASVFHLSRGRWHEVQRIIDQVRSRGALSPEWIALQARLLHCQGEPRASLKFLQERKDRLDKDGKYRMGLILAGTGQSQEAMEILKPIETEMARCVDAGVETSEFRVIMAGIAMASGQEEDALTWLQAAVDSGWRDHRLLAIDPAFSPLQDMPSYQVLMEDLRTRVAVMRARVEELGLLNK